MSISRRALLSVLLLSWMAPAVRAQVTSERLLRSADEPQNWLTYSGTYSSQRYSQLHQVTPANVKDLEMKWVFQAQSLNSFSATPLVIDGIMYLTQAPNDVVALDAATGRTFWVYRYAASAGRLCCRGLVNRGLAILGDTLFMATVDAHLIALDAKNGQPLWNTKVAESKENYGMTLAPLVVKDKVVVGVAGGEFGVRGFVAAYDAGTGKEAWRFYTIPGPGERGHETWKDGGDAWKHGGAPVWLTGSYDPELNLTYWGTGNPGPDYNPGQRPGDNLFSDSVVALDADTGTLRWYFQFTPNDPYDYDSVQIPVLVDADWNGSPRKLMLWGNRNGFFYVLDRSNGKFLLGRPYASINWASGLDEHGRPIRTPQPAGVPTYPGQLGATNWYSPSYSPRTGLFYMSTWEKYAAVFGEGDPIEFKAGQNFTGGRNAPVPGAAPMPGMARGPINTWNEGNAFGVVRAIDPRTGKQKWNFEMHDVTTSGILTTASDLLFVGGREGYFQALDAKSGALLWKVTVGGETAAAPITYMVDGKQYVAIAAGHSLFSFALHDR
jgi:alcohol dehydrogenase (cytochrome c)